MKNNMKNDRRYDKMNQIIENAPMSYLDRALTWLIGVGGATFTFISNNSTREFKILIAVMVIDVLSGLIIGFKDSELNSKAMKEGVFKKLGIIMLILLTVLLDYLINQGNPLFTTLAVWMSIGNESLSITENLNKLGVPIPKIILSKLKDMSKEDGEIDIINNVDGEIDIINNIEKNKEEDING